MQRINSNKNDDSKLQNRQSKSKFERVEYLLNILNQMLIGFITIYMFWICLHNYLVGTALHAFLVTIGFSFLLAEGIMCHYENNVLTLKLSHQARSALHALLQIFGGGCGLAGGIIKLVQNKFPINSLHGKLGFATLILCFITLLIGFMTLHFSKSRDIVLPPLIRLIHNVLGIGTFVMALVTQSYGYNKKLITNNAPFDFVILLKVMTLVSLVLTCIGPMKSLFRKITLHFKSQSQ